MLDLLVAMGHGGVDEQARRLGGSGGVDGVGVRTRHTYRVVELDENFFE